MRLQPIEPNLPLPNWPKWNKEIASVLTYVRNNFGNTSSLITEAEVRA
ncbi:hypothetical protein IDJ75_07060 [Mucilaginibacter rigui]|uniref:Uncharacterized protein n=1 Tax=Mucilaginibacter rigui TaxID=534635 RepID=A0ABR7X361_9SPHI|nr:hypothetical protein [Mucilaginibacter rigui]MBD1385033.1 hypothetical protein [Mucilaginibacter rigui]